MSETENPTPEETTPTPQAEGDVSEPTPSEAESTPASE